MQWVRPAQTAKRVAGQWSWSRYDAPIGWGFGYEKANRVQSCAGDLPGMACQWWPTSLPDAWCNHSRHKPRLLNRSDRGSDGDRAHPGPGSDRSIAPSKDALPEEARDNSRLPPSGRFGRDTAEHLSYYADIRLRLRNLHPRFDCR